MATYNNISENRLDQQPVSVGQVKSIPCAWTIIVVHDLEETFLRSDLGGSLDFFGHNMRPHPNFSLQFLEHDQRVVGVIAVPHSEERAWSNLANREGALVDHVLVGSKMGCQLLLEVRCWYSGVECNGEHSQGRFPEKGHNLPVAVAWKSPASVELEKA